jgi:hypothetical protein
MKRTWQFDKKIAPLVRAINAYGIMTVQSCQGHMEPWGGDSIVEPYPWILLCMPVLDSRSNLGSQRVDQLAFLIQDFNLRGTAQWDFCHAISSWSPMNRLPGLSGAHYLYLVAEETNAQSELLLVQASIAQLVSAIKAS